MKLALEIPVEFERGIIGDRRQRSGERDGPPPH